MTKKEKLAAQAMLADYIRGHGVTDASQLPADLRALALKVRPKRQHGPASPKRGIGAVSQADLFRGL